MNTNTFTIRLYSLFLLFLVINSHLLITSAFRIPSAPAVRRCSTVAFWSANADHVHTDKLSTSLYAAGQKKRNKITFKNIEEVLERFYEEHIGLFFGMNSCGPCQSMKEVMKQVHSALGNDLLFFHVDIDRWPSVATKMDVTHAPTLLLFQQGQVQLRMEGMVPAEAVLQELNSFLGHNHQQR